jgi:DNA-binding beta-propeller fold protein YncE
VKMAARLPVLATATITGLALAATAAAPAGAGPLPHRSAAIAASGTKLWLARFGEASVGTDVVASPLGSAVFVTGWSIRTTSLGPIDEGTTVAYNPATGARLWAAHYSPGEHSHVNFSRLAVSPDGSRVFVIASDFELSRSSGRNFLTVAYNATTGAQLWADKTTMKGNLNSVAVSPDGNSVYVTGESASGSTPTTVAYNAATGAQLWAQDPGVDGAAIAVSPDGSSVYVTGGGAGGDATVGFSAATGRVLWSSPAAVAPRALVVSPDESRLFITGAAGTQAYTAATGERLWTTPDSFTPGAIAISPDGAAVFITDLGIRGAVQLAHVHAYAAATGARLWSVRTSIRQGSLAVSPDGTKLFLAGVAPGPDRNHPTLYGTAALSTGTGAELWIERYQSTFTASANAVAVSPDGSRVFVTGEVDSPLPAFVPSIVTLAYSS